MAKIKIKDIEPSENASQTLTTDVSGNPQWSTVAPAGVSWGGITGTLANQTDLQTALDDIEALALAGL